MHFCICYSSPFWVRMKQLLNNKKITWRATNAYVLKSAFLLYTHTPSCRRGKVIQYFSFGDSPPSSLSKGGISYAGFSSTKILQIKKIEKTPLLGSLPPRGRLAADDCIWILVFFRQYRTILMAQLRRQKFRQTNQIEAGNSRSIANEICEVWRNLCKQVCRHGFVRCCLYSADRKEYAQPCPFLFLIKKQSLQ